MDRGDEPLEVLWEDGERLYRRMWRDTGDGNRREFLVAQPCAEHPTPATISRLTHEYGLKDYLDHPWALRPLELVREHGQTLLVLESTKAVPLDQIIGPGAPVEMFLRLAITVANAVARVHQCGFVHKDLRASNDLRRCLSDWETVRSKRRNERRPRAARESRNLFELNMIM